MTLVEERRPKREGEEEIDKFNHMLRPSQAKSTQRKSSEYLVKGIVMNDDV